MTNTRPDAHIVNGQAAPDQGGRIRGFDGLRAIAFLLVFASHKVYFRHADSFGDAGVWMFFVLSGFLITRILARSRAGIESGSSSITNSLTNFYLRRTARIFPPYYLVLAAAGACSLFVPIDHFGRLEKLAYLLYGTNILVAFRGEWVGDFGHFWSLAVEEQFYLLFAPLVLLVPRRNTMSVCLAIMSAGIAAKIALEAEGAPAVAIDVNSLANFVLLGFGGVIGLNVSRKVPKWLCGGEAQLLVLCVYLATPAIFGTSQIWPLAGKLSAVLAGILLFQIFNAQRSWFVAILDSAPLRKIGRISYGAYLIHHFVYFATIDHVLQHFGAQFTAPRPIQLLTELGISLALAAISWRYFERPVIAWAARVTARKTSAIAAPATPSRAGESPSYTNSRRF